MNLENEESPMKRLSDEEKAELQAKMKKSKRSWVMPALVVAGVIIIGILATIPQCLSGLHVPPRAEWSTHKSFLVIALVVLIVVAIPTLMAIWFLVKRWPEQWRNWFRRWRK